MDAKEGIRVSEVINKCLSKIKSDSRKLKKFPHITKNGRWETTSDGYWTGGFWIGLPWLSFKLTNDRKYVRLAYNWLKLLEKRKEAKTFDLGFLFYPSFVFGYKITEDNSLSKTALESADDLATLLNDKANFICILISKKVGRTAIDIMMNLTLLWWDYEETGKEKYYTVAYEHTKSTIKDFVRKDGSTVHVIDFDLRSGDIIRKGTIQGYNESSCWSRGQAWGIYGFALAYKTAKHISFLETAKKLSTYFIRNAPDDYVPYWDFNDSKIPNAPKDSSAAAIACCGLMKLFELTKKKKFWYDALKILNSLSSKYLERKNLDGILKHGCFHKPMNIGVDESLIKGDYYFMEVLMKTSGEEYEEDTNR